MCGGGGRGGLTFFSVPRVHCRLQDCLSQPCAHALSWPQQVAYGVGRKDGAVQSHISRSTLPPGPAPARLRLGRLEVLGGTGETEQVAEVGDAPRLPGALRASARQGGAHVHATSTGPRRPRVRSRP